MMGIVFLNFFVANSLIGWIGSYYERMSPLRFWALHAAIAAMGAVMLPLLGRRLGVLAGAGTRALTPRCTEQRQT